MQSLSGTINKDLIRGHPWGERWSTRVQGEKEMSLTLFYLLPKVQHWFKKRERERAFFIVNSLTMACTGKMVSEFCVPCSPAPGSGQVTMGHLWHKANAVPICVPSLSKSCCQLHLLWVERTNKRKFLKSTGDALVSTSDSMVYHHGLCRSCHHPPHSKAWNHTYDGSPRKW